MTPDEQPSLSEVIPGGEGRPKRRPPREDWAPVPDWPYEASSRGRVRSLARRKPLRPQRDKDGYRYVELSDGQRRQRVHVARLVLLAFAGEPEPGMEACHRNGRRWDNRRSNVYWGTKPENRQERERHRREREVRRTGRTVGGIETDGKDEKQDGIEETACCRLESESGVSPC